MKKVFGIKSKTFLVGGGSILILLLILVLFKSTLAQDQTTCGYLESPIFDLGTTTSVTKFLWKGVEESALGGDIKFTLFVGSNTSSLQSIEIDVPAYNVYYFVGENANLKKIRYLKYKVELCKTNEYAVPRVDQIFIYYTK